MHKERASPAPETHVPREKEHIRWNKDQRVAALTMRMSKRPKCATVVATASSAFLTSRTSAGKVSTCAEGRSHGIVSLVASVLPAYPRRIIRDAPACAKCKAISGADAARCTSDQDDFAVRRKSLRVVMDLWVDERIEADKFTVLLLLQQAGH